MNDLNIITIKNSVFYRYYPHMRLVCKFILLKKISICNIIVEWKKISLLSGKRRMRKEVLAKNYYLRIEPGGKIRSMSNIIQSIGKIKNN